MNSLFDNLWTRGGDGAPTDMSQIKVQQQPMDLAGTIPAANSQLQYDPSAGGSSIWGNMGRGAMMVGASAIAGMNQPGQAPAMGQAAAQFQGARTPEVMNAEKLSGARLGDQQKFAQMGGLMNASK